MLAKNFKFLYKYYNDKQTELAKMFHVPQSNISSYQNGKMPIPVDILEKIAIRYNVSIDDLTKKDLSLEYDTPQTIDLNGIMTLGDNILPILTSNIAKANDNFNRAYEKLLSSWHCDTIDAFYGRISILEQAVTLFQKAWEESNTYVALSNSISTILLIYTFYSQQGIKIAKELLNKETLNTFDIRKSFLRDPNKTLGENPYKERQKSFFEKYEDSVYNNIKLLKNNLPFSELGDYYLAVCWFLGFTEDYVEYELSSQIGIYMLDQLCKINNKYAERFVESLP